MTMSMLRVVLILLLSVAAQADFSLDDGLLPNGNFEQGPHESEMNGARVMGRYSIPNWEISGYVEYIGSGQMQDDMILPVPDGDHAVRLGNDASIRQRLKLHPHTSYSITFAAARSCAQEEKLNVSADPDSAILPIQTVYTSSGWDSYSFAFEAKYSAVWFSIHNPGLEENPACGPLIDFIAIRTLRLPPRTSANMLKNGDFEVGPYTFPSVSGGVLVPPLMEDAHSPLPGWMVMSDTKVVKYVDAAHHAVPQGSYAVELVAGRETALLQEVATEPGQRYRLCFSVGDAGDGCQEPLGVDVYAAQETTRVSYESQGTGGHQRAELEFTAVDKVTRVVFQSWNHHMTYQASLCGPVIDDVSLFPVYTYQHHMPGHGARRLRIEAGRKGIRRQRFALFHPDLIRRECAMMTPSTLRVTLVLLLAVAARADFSLNDGLLPNGNFEQGPPESEINGTRVMGRYSIPNWEISGFVEYIASGHMEDDMIIPVPDGDHAVRLGNDATIRQRLKLHPHTTYSITFAAARSCAQEEKLNVSAEPDSGILPIQTVYTSSGWDSYSFAFEAKYSAVWFSIHNPGHEENPACGPLIDFIAIKTLRLPPRTSGNMVKNGDFEIGPYTFPGVLLDGVLVPPIMEDVHSPLPGWMVMSDTKVVKYVDAAHHAVPQGAYAVELVAGRETALVQEVAGTVPGRRYRLRFSVGDSRNGCEGTLGVDVYAAQVTTRVSYESRGTGGHQRAELEFMAVDNVTRVVFQSWNHHMTHQASLCGPVVDDVSLFPAYTQYRQRLPGRGARRLRM
ncbi:hypothetical protein QOZ80_4BG0343520 [Eleusine coracana subsp. coracana]|nr:hypothetical protein QOZ80_4BG0343520 [Eleusine coracana subsp. coracana]